MSNFEAFRNRVRDHLRQAGFQQQQLADKLGLSNGMLSRKLNQTDGKFLTAAEIKNIVRVLADWHVIVRRSEAIELLECANLNAGSFALDEWKAAPLAELEQDAASAVARPVATAQKHNLPPQMTALVGRETEVELVCELLQNPETRLLTMTGPGGIGKTRLALRAASELLPHFADGAYFVGLDTVSDYRLIPFVIAQTLGVKETGREPLPETLKNHLQPLELLLVLDNFEQVVAGATFLKELLLGAPGVRALVTSRAVLHLYGEREFAVPPLALPDTRKLPDLTTLGQIPSVRLFVERARQIKHDFMLSAENAAPVAEICARLDGLPLAIELAAARTRLFTPAKICERLVNCLKELSSGAPDLPLRQQSLRAAIEWSYNLLSPDEQMLWRRLAVFAGGATLEAIENVCNPDAALTLDLTEGVMGLLDKSLLRRHETESFQMLDMLREYAGEKLEAHAESDLLRRRHAAYYLDLAEAAVGKLETGDNTAVWLNRLDAEHPNLRAALKWALGRKPDGELCDADLALRYGRALYPFWINRYHYTEGRAWLDAILTLCPPNPDHEVTRTEILTGAAMLTQGDNARARALYEEALAICRKLGDKRRVQRILNNLAVIELQEQQIPKAQTLLEESLALAQEMGDRRRVVANLTNLGIIAFNGGDNERARTLYEEALDISRAVGDKGRQSDLLNNLSLIAQKQNDFVKAYRLLEESLALARELGNRQSIALNLVNLGTFASLQKDWAKAAVSFEEALAAAQEIGHKRTQAAAALGLALVAISRADYGRAASWATDSLRLDIEMGNKYGQALGLTALAKVAAAHGKYEEATRLLANARAHVEATGHRSLAHMQEIYDRLIEECRASIGEQHFDAAWQAGHEQPVVMSHL
jgi:predicted ATPase/Tfp pilus assembly protein PilF/transcriptional regulator with XRE-family HTH domain